MLAIKPQTNSFCSTKRSGPGCRPHTMSPPSSTAAVADPGMPSASIGSSALVPAACAAVSGAKNAFEVALAEGLRVTTMRFAVP